MAIMIFQSSFHIDTGELDLESLPDEMDKEFKAWLARDIEYKIGALFKHRWRRIKFKKNDAWKEKDWSWWEADVLLSCSYVEVIGFEASCPCFSANAVDKRLKKQTR